MELLRLYNENSNILEQLSKAVGVPSVVVNGEIFANPVDGDALVCELLAQLGTMSVVYDPQIFKQCVDSWCKLNTHRWHKMIRTLCFKYDPISNYDRTETWEDSTERSDETSSSGKTTAQQNATRKTVSESSGTSSDTATAKTTTNTSGTSKDNNTSETDSTSSGTSKENNTSSTTSNGKTVVEGSTSKTGENIEKTAGYNSDALTTKGSVSSSENGVNNSETTVNSEDETVVSNNGETSGETNSKTTVVNSGETSGESETDASVSNSGENSSSGTVDETVGNDGESTSENATSSSGNVRTLRTGRAYGNIGVTTTQEMIESERKLLAFRFYQVVIDEFKERFMILVY